MLNALYLNTSTIDKVASKCIILICKKVHLKGVFNVQKLMCENQFLRPTRIDYKRYTSQCAKQTMLAQVSKKPWGNRIQGHTQKLDVISLILDAADPSSSN